MTVEQAEDVSDSEGGALVLFVEKKKKSGGADGGWRLIGSSRGKKIEDALTIS